MFPLNWNIPFIRKNGSRTTLGAITGDIAGIEEDVNDLTDKTDGLWDNMLENGAVNLCQNNASSESVNGVTFTVNADKTISVSTGEGGATANAYCYFWDCEGKEPFIGKEIILSGCPSGGATNKYKIVAYHAQSQDGSTGSPEDIGEGIKFTWLNNGSGTKARVYIVIYSGTILTTPIVFKPMISDASLNLSYDDYVPYAMTNRELTTPVYFNLSVRNDRCTIDEQSNFRIGKQVYIRCKFTPIVSGTDLPILTIPEGYRPKALGSNDVGVALNLVPKYNNADRTNFMWALAFATGEVDCLTLSQNNAYLLCGTYFLE